MPKGAIVGVISGNGAVNRPIPHADGQERIRAASESVTPCGWRVLRPEPATWMATKRCSRPFLTVRCDPHRKAASTKIRRVPTLRAFQLQGWRSAEVRQTCQVGERGRLHLALTLKGHSQRAAARRTVNDMTSRPAFARRSVAGLPWRRHCDLTTSGSRQPRRDAHILAYEDGKLASGLL
jgi:hypothetical protein